MEKLRFFDMGGFGGAMDVYGTFNDDGDFVVSEDVQYHYDQDDYDPGMAWSSDAAYTLRCIIQRPAGGVLRTGTVLYVDSDERRLRDRAAQIAGALPAGATDDEISAAIDPRRVMSAQYRDKVRLAVMRLRTTAA